MKKQLRFLMLCLILLFTLAMAAGCREEPAKTPTEPERLATPTRLWMQGESLVWDDVTHADAYLVAYGETEEETEESIFLLSGMDAAATFTVRVKAISYDLTYTDSDWATYTYEPATPGLAYTISDDARGYLVSRGKADLTGRIVIPDSYQEIPVIGIDNYGFAIRTSENIAKNTKTTGFRFPALLESIGVGAFEQCVALTDVPLPNSLSVIGKRAFCGDASLERIVIPESITAIPTSCFNDCAILQEVSLPETLLSIGIGAFSNCWSLTSIDLPDGLTEIGTSAFKGCERLRKIALPEGVTTVGDSAFRYCFALREVTFSETVTYIGELAFDGCASLGTFSLPPRLTYLSATSFSDTLWYDTLPEGFVIVRGDILYGYKGTLPQDTVLDPLPAGVCYIAGSAFLGQTGLVSVTLPDGVSFLGGRIFSACTSLVSIRLPADLTEIPEGLFLSCKSLTSVIIPAGVTVIGKQAFEYCSSLTDIILPESVTSVEKNAFNRCTSFSCVYVRDAQFSWQSVSLQGGNTPLQNARVFRYSEAEPPLTADGTAYDGNYWHYAPGGVTPTVWEKGS